MTRLDHPSQVTLDVGLDEIDDPVRLRERVARVLGIAAADLPESRVLRRSIDARGGRVKYHVRVALGSEAASRPRPTAPEPREVKLPARVIIIGDGPAGLFCAYQLACAGVASVVLDRGKTVQPRRHDLVLVQNQGRVDPNSNYCFGEGGAGTYSDGKLYTRSNKRGNVARVLGILVDHGAPDDIESDARPHIGSNRLPKVVTALREHLEGLGVEFRFEARVSGLDLVSDQGRSRVRGVRLQDGSIIGADVVVLATGHSARDVLTWLGEAGARLEPKPFAVGLRVEHPQALINRMQYGAVAQHPRLPSADYHLAYTEAGRGVFSFCMCPGGFIIPAVTEPDALVVNGMSLSRRDSPYANSGLVVGVEPDDLAGIGLEGALGGVELQRRLETAAYLAGGGGFRAPATRVTDFLAGRGSSTLPASSYRPGLSATNVGELLDGSGLGLAERLRRALGVFGRRMSGYITEEAVLVGVETRTSSPVRIPRNPETLEHPEILGLIPIGEGAGYAGGIVSSALDGMRAADAIWAISQGR